VAGLLAQAREPVSAIPFMRRAVELFPGDPEILMMAGALHELLASPKELASEDSGAGRQLHEWRGAESSNLRDAARCYRDALKADPARVEARIRLGRVLELQERYADAVAAAARSTDVVVYSVTAGDVGRRTRDFLDQVGGLTGGGLLTVEATADLGKAFSGILDEFRHRYLLSFVPTGVSKTGWHELDVRVLNHRAVVKARTGYQAGS
jgi:tetratricopeptide (TPR) repeat protein